MSSRNTHETSSENAEQRFRDAFERLKNGQSRHQKIGTTFTQADVAREAGCDPSALKKARHPGLIAEIQQYLSIQHSRPTKHLNQKTSDFLKPPALLAKIELLQLQRDHALSLLVEADTKILELSRELEKARQAAKNSSHEK